MRDIYKILRIPEQHWEKLDADYWEIVKNNLAADLSEGLTREEGESLQKAIEGKKEILPVLKQWAGENSAAGKKLGERLKESWLNSTTKFLEALMTEASPQQKSDVVGYLQKTEYNG